MLESAIPIQGENRFVGRLADNGSVRRAPFHEAVEDVLRGLYEQGRRAVRIADLDCGSGRRLVRVARRARQLGFVAVEARGCARTRAEAESAAKAAHARHDPAIGMSFDAAGLDAALAEEVDEGADLVIATADRLPDTRRRPAAPILLTHRVHVR